MHLYVQPPFSAYHGDSLSLNGFDCLGSSGDGLEGAEARAGLGTEGGALGALRDPLGLGSRSPHILRHTHRLLVTPTRLVLHNKGQNHRGPIGKVDILSEQLRSPLRPSMMSRQCQVRSIGRRDVQHIGDALGDALLESPFGLVRLARIVRARTLHGGEGVAVLVGSHETLLGGWERLFATVEFTQALRSAVGTQTTNRHTGTTVNFS